MGIQVAELGGNVMQGRFGISLLCGVSLQFRLIASNHWCQIRAVYVNYPQINVE